MTQRDVDKAKVKRVLRHPGASGKQITDALVEYFRQYTMKDILVASKREDVVEDLDNTGMSVAAEDLLTVFDGGLF